MKTFVFAILILVIVTYIPYKIVTGDGIVHDARNVALDWGMAGEIR